MSLKGNESEPLDNLMPKDDDVATESKQQSPTEVQVPENCENSPCGSPVDSPQSFQGRSHSPTGPRLESMPDSIEDSADEITADIKEKFG